jgi:hypothetical protein
MCYNQSPGKPSICDNIHLKHDTCSDGNTFESAIAQYGMLSCMHTLNRSSYYYYPTSGKYRHFDIPGGIPIFITCVTTNTIGIGITIMSLLVLISVVFIKCNEPTYVPTVMLDPDSDTDADTDTGSDSVNDINMGLIHESQV